MISVLLHELGHVRVALKQEVAVRSVTLMMLGGISEMGQMPKKPYAELRLAVAGPLVSLLLAGSLLLASEALSRDTSPNLKLLTLWVGSVNLGLGLFNLLPAFPLDGGRALRSMLAARRGIIPATQTAVRLGTFFAAVLGVLGLLSFNIFLLLIAFFLYGAGQSEMFQIMSAAALRGMKVKDLMITTPVAEAEETLLDVSEKMIQSGYSELPVRPTGARPETSLASLVTIQQIRRVPREFRHITLVQDVMSDGLQLLDPENLLSDTLPELTAQSFGILPVRMGENDFGVLRLSEISRTLQFESIAPAQANTQSKTETKAA